MLLVSAVILHDCVIRGALHGFVRYFIGLYLGLGAICKAIPGNIALIKNACGYMGTYR